MSYNNKGLFVNQLKRPYKVNSRNSTSAKAPVANPPPCCRQLSGVSALFNAALIAFDRLHRKQARDEVVEFGHRCRRGALGCTPG
ncbi:unnamed protein product [Soboliphyme baturini]|uniref:Uncharacterized protein n=1 Tax=Soboliphyme baturini TaxID=241478 RepID=A0A183J0I0_9BILA|nr:unnamed protein product [Soboliphyme baturini]